MNKNFNYIIPVFNKEDVLPLTLAGVDRCASKEAKILTVIDGCTDRSEALIDEFINRTGRNVTKIHMPDVHMLRSVNAGLRHVNQGFSVVMQDDIILEDNLFEQKIFNLYEEMGPRLGVISLRLGSNLQATPLVHRLAARRISPMISEHDFIMSKDDNQKYSVGNYQRFYPRMSAINGPNIIPWSVRSEIGIFDEALAPYGFDDPEYCLRAMKSGFINGLYPLKFRSDLQWGGTRRSKKFLKEARRIHCRNRQYVWNKHGEYISWLSRFGHAFSSDMPVDNLEQVPNCTQVQK